MADLAAADEALRKQIGALLGSLQTEWRERGGTSEAVNTIVARLRIIAADDYPAKLVTAGFTPTPFVGDADDIAQACATCMYYSQHRQFCELPELLIPVRPEWSCRLWRI